MTQTEIVVLQHDAALFRQCRAENAKLREALGEKTEADRKMAQEDADAINLVTRNRDRVRLVLMDLKQDPAIEHCDTVDDFADFDLDEEPLPFDPPMSLGWRILLSAAAAILIWYARRMGWEDVLTWISILFTVLLLLGFVR